MLRLVNTQFSYAGAQCTAVEPKDFCSPVLAAYLPMSLLKYPDDIVTLDLFSVFRAVVKSLCCFFSSSTRCSLGPEELITARSRTFSNSLILPGH